MSLPVKLEEEIIINEDDFKESLKMLTNIKHKACRSAAIHNYWVPCWNKDKNVAIIRPNNVFWLYFWAETGQGSKKAAIQSRIVFYDIFGTERPYGVSVPDYENFFSKFDSALESTGIPFRVEDCPDNKNNPERDRLRPYKCTDHCIDVFRKVMKAMPECAIDKSKFLSNAIIDLSLLD